MCCKYLGHFLPIHHNFTKYSIYSTIDQISASGAYNVSLWP